jgi:predicted permease
VIRHALGAGKAALVRQMLAESLLLTAGAAAIGTVLAWGLLQVLNRYVPIVVHEAPPLRLDWAVLGTTLLGAIGIALVFGLVPFALLWREGLNLGAVRTASASGKARLVSNTLIVAQVAIALLLLAGAGLLIRSFANVMGVEPGFDAAQVVQGRVALPMAKYSVPKDNIGLQQRLLASMREIPGVESVAMVGDFGIAQSYNTMAVTFRDTAAKSGECRPLSYYHWVSPAYFDTMGIRLLEGRVFNDDDKARGIEVSAVIVDQAFAERYFPGRSAVGQEISFYSSGSPESPVWIRIVGVVARAQLTGLEGRDGYPFVYMPLNLRLSGGFTFLFRSHRPAAEVITAAREHLRAVDPTLPLYATGSLQQSIEDMLLTRRAVMVLLSGFAGLALLLAGVGLYGVLAYDVSQRTREIGIRGALGASREQIVGLILRQGLVKALLGLGLGLGGAFYLTRLLRKMLFDVQPTDPLAFTAVALLLLLVGLLASWLPARRAAKVDPVIALRAE